MLCLSFRVSVDDNGHVFLSLFMVLNSHIYRLFLSTRPNIYIKKLSIQITNIQNDSNPSLTLKMVSPIPFTSNRILVLVYSVPLIFLMAFIPTHFRSTMNLTIRKSIKINNLIRHV